MTRAVSREVTGRVKESPCRRRLWGILFVLFFAGACRGEAREVITVGVGPTPVYRFEPQAAFAHYYELPSRRDVLRIVLGSYPMSCEHYEPPKAGDVLITITVHADEGRPLAPGKFPYEGDSEREDEKPEERKGATVLPFVRLAEDARALPPGGFLTLTQFSPEPSGLIEGELAFRDESGGQGADVSMTALLGKFSLRLCRVVRDPSRQQPVQEK